MPQMPEPGQPAPAFTATTGTGDALSLADYRGRWVLLYFYPKDDTPGCTKQACNLRDNYQALADAGVAVIGVSPDSGASHARFREKYDLPFPLVTDTDRSVMEAYGTWGPKNRYGRLFDGVHRTSFLIDPEGTVRHVFKRPKTGEHADEVLAKLQPLTEAGPTGGTPPPGGGE
jgi:thioredoxin-dependent peroxiredoxin